MASRDVSRFDERRFEIATHAICVCGRAWVRHCKRCDWKVCAGCGALYDPLTKRTSFDPNRT